MNTSSHTYLPLDPWRSRQAAMLYHYSSLEYLKGLYDLVSGLINGVVDPLLDLALLQQRDAVMTDQRWGNRNTSANWSNNAWPFLKDLQASLARDITMRGSGRYSFTAVNNCLRGLDEYSMDWATDAEEQMYRNALRAISRYSTPLDDTLETHMQSGWSDYEFAYYYIGFVHASPRIPRFRVRSDIVGESGKLPPQTGVYVAVDDPNAALQFAWNTDSGCPLRLATTFNDVGLAALKAVGRKDLWFNEQRMLDFATAAPYTTMFKDDVFIDGEDDPTLAPSAVARAGFTNRECKWNFVEIIPNEYEDSMLAWDSARAPATTMQRLEGGEVCTLPGYYFSPARPGSRRRFDAAERMPIFASEYGKTVWQWDDNQSA